MSEKYDDYQYKINYSDMWEVEERKAASKFQRNINI